MRIISIKSASLPEIRVIKYGRFTDHRGYFTETFRKSDFFSNPNIDFFKNIEFVQSNESFSKATTLRGLHLQWNPSMGKLVRTLSGHMIDLFLDVRLKSPTFGKIAAYDMPNNENENFGEWIWIPPGFAHGNVFLEDTLIEYYCTGEYNPNCEACISPLSKDMDWSLCDKSLKKIFDEIAPNTKFITEKDRNGYSIQQWKKEKNSQNFIFSKS